MQSIFKLYLVQLPDSKADLCFSALFHHFYTLTLWWMLILRFK